MGYNRLLAQAGFSFREMNEDHPSPHPQKTWLERIGQLVSGEPRNIDELLEELRGAQANGLLSNDTLSMVEGAIEVSDLTVADVMLPRGQMVCLSSEAKLPENRQTGYRIRPFAFSRLRRRIRSDHRHLAG